MPPQAHDDVVAIQAVLVDELGKRLAAELGKPEYAGRKPDEIAASISSTRNVATRDVVKAAVDQAAADVAAAGLTDEEMASELAEIASIVADVVKLTPKATDADLAAVAAPLVQRARSRLLGAKVSAAVEAARQAVYAAEQPSVVHEIFRGLPFAPNAVTAADVTAAAGLGAMVITP